MANIKINHPIPVLDGMAVTFRSPADISEVSGLVVCYADPDGGEEIRIQFQFSDAHGNNVGDLNLFAADAMVKVILDTVKHRAYVQNADTNAYLENQFKSKAPVSHLSDKSNPHGVTAAQVGAVSINPQALTEGQQTQARENIGAASRADADRKLPLTGGDMTGWIDFGQATCGLRWKTDDGTVFTFRPYAAGNVLQVTRKMPDGSEYGVLNIYTNGRVEVEGASDSLERVHNIMVVPAGTDVGSLSLSAGTIVMVRK